MTDIEGGRTIDQSPHDKLGLTDQALNHAFRDIPRYPTLLRGPIRIVMGVLRRGTSIALKPLDKIAEDFEESPETHERLITASVADAVRRSALSPEQEKKELANALGGMTVVDALFLLVSGTHTPDASLDLLTIGHQLVSGEQGKRDPRRQIFNTIVTAIDKAPVPTPFFNLHIMGKFADDHELSARLATLTYLSDRYFQSESVDPKIQRWARQSFILDNKDYLPQLARVLPERVPVLATRIEELTLLEAPLQVELRRLHNIKLNMRNEPKIKQQVHETEIKWQILRREYTYLMGLYLEQRALLGIINKVA